MLDGPDLRASANVQLRDTLQYLAYFANPFECAAAASRQWTEFFLTVWRQLHSCVEFSLHLLVRVRRLPTALSDRHASRTALSVLADAAQDPLMRYWE